MVLKRSEGPNGLFSASGYTAISQEAMLGVSRAAPDDFFLGVPNQVRCMAGMTGPDYYSIPEIHFVLVLLERIPVTEALQESSI